MLFNSGGAIFPCPGTFRLFSEDAGDVMKITGFRTLRTAQHWGRPVGDVNGFISDGITEVPIVIVERRRGGFTFFLSLRELAGGDTGVLNERFYVV